MANLLNVDFNTVCYIVVVAVFIFIFVYNYNALKRLGTTNNTNTNINVKETFALDSVNALDSTNLIGADNITIILLDRAGNTNRKEHVYRELQKHKLQDVNIFSAIDGNNLKPYDIQRLVESKYFSADSVKQLRRGQIGCAMSHLLLWEKMIKDNLPYMLILEDDFTLVDGFDIKVQQAMQQVPKDYDIFYLFLNKCCLEAEVINNNNGMSIIMPTYPLGLVGYFISNKGAKKLMYYLRPLATTIDSHLAMVIKSKLSDIKAYAVRENLVTHDYVFESTIWTTERLPS